MSAFCEQFAIAKNRTSPFHAQSNSIIERFHRSLGHMMRAYIEKSDYRSWDRYVSLLSMAHNSAVNRNTGFSPYELVFGRRCVFPIDIVLDLPGLARQRLTPVEWVAQVRSKLEECHELAREHIGVWQHRQKRDYDLKSYERKYVPGDVVFKLDTSIEAGRSKKLGPVYCGPLVVKSASHPLYTLLTRKGAETVIHHDRLIKAAVNRFLPFRLRRQTADIIANVEKSAQQSNESTVEVGEDSGPNLATKAVNRPVGPIRQELKRQTDHARPKKDKPQMIEDYGEAIDSLFKEPVTTRTGRRTVPRQILDL